MSDAVKTGDRPVSVEVEGLTHRYGELTALNKISFRVHAGEIVGFLGPNGAGKTTAMKILTCFMGATSGVARVAGFDVAQQSLEVRRRVGYLPETVPLYPEMLVYDYLAFVARMRQVPAAELHARIVETCRVCGLTHRANSFIRDLSKGYRQRVGLAQALIHKPEVVILDEPTSGLDPHQLVEIRELIKEIGREKTILFSTHILQEVAAVCDRIIIIHGGALVADGTVAELEAQVRQDDHTTLVVRDPRGEGPGRLLTTLRALEGVREVEALGAAGREHALQIVSEPGRSLGAALSAAAAAAGFEVIELRRERPSLEDLFRILTGDADRVAAERRRRAQARLHQRGS